MGWKDWPYWLKGGLIFFIICQAITLVLFLSGLMLVVGLMGFVTFILFPLGIKYGGIAPISSVMVLIYLVIQFLLGALIGLIYGKIKNK